MDTHAETPMEETPKTSQQIFITNLKSKYPDTENEDDLYKKSMEGYDADHERLKNIIASNKDVSSRLMNDPQAGAAFHDYLNGTPLPVALRKYFFDEELNMKEGEDGYEEFLEVRKEKLAQVEKSKAMQAETEANLEASVADIQKFADEKGLDEAQMNEFLQRLDNEIIQPVAKCQLTYDFLTKSDNFLNHDQNVADAQKMGEIKAKNEKFIEKRTTADKQGLTSLNEAGIPPPTT